MRRQMIVFMSNSSHWLGVFAPLCADLIHLLPTISSLLLFPVWVSPGSCIWPAHKCLPVFSPAPLLMPWPVGPSSYPGEAVLRLVPPSSFPSLSGNSASLPPCMSLHAFQSHFWTMDWFSFLQFECFKWLHYCLPLPLRFLFLSNFSASCNFFSSVILGFKLMTFSSHSPWLHWILIWSPSPAVQIFIYTRLNSKLIPSSQLFLSLVATGAITYFFLHDRIPLFVLFYAFEIFDLE